MRVALARRGWLGLEIFEAVEIIFLRLRGNLPVELIRARLRMPFGRRDFPSVNSKDL